MKLHEFVEKYFWIFLILGMVAGLIFPVCNDMLMNLLKPFLMLMLLFVFLKIDVSQVFNKLKNYRLMSWIVLLNMIGIPVMFFFIIKNFDMNMAIAVLLLTSMPAGISTPVFTDILEGDTAFSTGIALATSMVAPFTVPLLFWLIDSSHFSINTWSLFKDLALMIFLPMMVSQLIKQYFTKTVMSKKHLFTSINILIMSIMVYAVLGSQKDILLNNGIKVVWQVVFLYLIFILLHLLGFMMGFTENIKSRIATAVGSAYINNGMAIVIASLYFEPSIVILMVLSEIPWNTLLVPFKKTMDCIYNKKNEKTRIC